MSIIERLRELHAAASWENGRIPTNAESIAYYQAINRVILPLLAVAEAAKQYRFAQDNSSWLGLTDEAKDRLDCAIANLEKMT